MWRKKAVTVEFRPRLSRRGVLCAVQAAAGYFTTIPAIVEQTSTLDTATVEYFRSSTGAFQTVYNCIYSFNFHGIDVLKANLSEFHQNWAV